MKVASLLLGLAVLMLSIHPALATFKMTNEVSCEGECNMVQSYNGETVSVTSEGNIKMSTTADDEGVEMKVEVEGSGTATIDAGGEVTTVSSSGASSKGSSSSGDLPLGGGSVGGGSETADAASYEIRNNTQNGTGNPAPQNGGIDGATNGESGQTGGAVSGFNWFGSGDVVEVYSDDTASAGTSEEPNLIHVEASVDGNEEEIHTSGTFHKVYTFLKSFVALIRIS